VRRSNCLRLVTKWICVSVNTKGVGPTIEIQQSLLPSPTSASGLRAVAEERRKTNNVPIFHSQLELQWSFVIPTPTALVLLQYFDSASDSALGTPCRFSSVDELPHASSSFSSARRSRSLCLLPHPSCATLSRSHFRRIAVCEGAKALFKPRPPAENVAKSCGADLLIATTFRQRTGGMYPLSQSKGSVRLLPSMHTMHDQGHRGRLPRACTFTTILRSPFPLSSPNQTRSGMLILVLVEKVSPCARQR
jgi:hypothetical protein